MPVRPGRLRLGLVGSGWGDGWGTRVRGVTECVDKGDVPCHALGMTKNETIHPEPIDSRTLPSTSYRTTLALHERARQMRQAANTKVCRTCTATLRASDPDVCEQCDLHGIR